MSEFWSPIVHDLVPYVPGEQPKDANLVKLNTNENPYGPSPHVIEAIKAAADEGLQLYPDPSATALKQVIADYHHIGLDHIFVGNGSDEVLAHAFHALFQHDEPILFPDITYSFYPVYCKLYQLDYQCIPLAEDFSLEIADYQRPNGGIIFPNPNAPTGKLLERVDIEALLKSNTETVVIIDEAYVDFGGDTAIDLVKCYPNLLVVQTLSKSRSLAGIRIGFAIGHPDLIDGLTRVKDSFNSYPMDKLAIAAGVAAFEDDAYFQQTRQQIITSRQGLIAELGRLGFEVVPSTANFIFVKHPKFNASDIAASLRKQGIIVRHFNAQRINQHLRITVGTETENTQLITVLRNVL